MNKISLIFLMILFGYSGGWSQPVSGNWNAQLQLREDHSLPFAFLITRSEKNTPVIQFLNGSEKIPALMNVKNDSIFVRFPVYDSEIRARFSQNEMHGVWLNHARKTQNVIAFKASRGEPFRFPVTRMPEVQVNGRWGVDFSSDGEDSSKAIGVFEQNGSVLTGTFLTPTGDYRFLEGVVSGDSLYLSCFDGAHAFLFKARVDKESLAGGFWSGSHWYETWSAVRNESFRLPDPYSLTFLNPGFDRFSFSFPQPDGKKISSDDPRFQGKVMVVQIMGSWCPNCMDESVFLSGYYRQNKKKGLEIVALAFERPVEFERAAANVNRLKERLGIQYPVLIAGSSSKKAASEALPMLNHVMSYPTTIIIDKKGNVRKIHTGFNGPATGTLYTEFVNKFDAFIQALLLE